MNRLEKKTTATLLIAIFMISALAVAIPVMAATNYDYGFQIQEEGSEVYLDTARAHSGTRSVKQVITGGTADNDARVKFIYGDTLNTLTSVDFWANLYTQEHSSFVGPYVSMSLDLDNDDVADAWLAQESQNYALDTWTHKGLDADSIVYITVSQTGGVGWKVGPISFSALKDTQVVQGAEPLVTYGDGTVLEIKVGIGTWGPDYDAIAFVDDVTIDGYLSPAPTQDFDNDSPLLMEANAAYAMVSITLSTYSVSFDPITIGGREQSETIQVTHTGSPEITETFTWNLIEDTNGFYAACLTLEAQPDNILNPGEYADVKLTLKVPANEGWEPDEYKGTYVFWAEYKAEAPL